MSEKKKLLVSLIGNPNCGKTTVFNGLTGSKQRVGNWPGVTVDKKIGRFIFEDTKVEVVDLPGTYAIETDKSDVSQDELVVRNFVLTDEESILVNILDASNIQRNLYLTFQLLDLKRPMVVVLNMMDVAKLKGFEIDVVALEKKLGCPVLPISANKGADIKKLKKLIASLDATKQQVASSLPTLSQTSEQMINTAFNDLDKDSVLHATSKWNVLEGILGYETGLSLTEKDKEVLASCREKLAEPFDGEIDIALASSRYEAIDHLAKDIIKTVGVASSELTEKLDKWALGRITGVPIFLFVMFLMFILAINVGSAFIDFFDVFFGAIFVDGTAHLLNSMNSPEWLVAILANGIGAGIQTVSTFIPVIAAMFFCLSFLEDSGYLARAAMVVDRGMRAIGLPGKAFVPMLVGFGCNIPAIMGTRTLESTRDRLMSIMMIPFMSCGARLPVYALFAAVFFSKSAGIIVYLLYLFGILVAILTGFAMKYSILKGKNTPFIMELPAYHLPKFKGLILLTWDRLKAFIYKAGKAIVIVVSLLGVLNTWGTDGSFGNENTNKSVLSSIGRNLTPMFEPMGVTEENWPATVGIFTGIFAKEAVIGTLNSLYTQMDADAEAAEEKSYDLWGSTKEALETIPKNLKELPSAFLDPLGVTGTVADGDLAIVQEDNEIDDATVTRIQQLFPSTAAVIAYLIFVLLYTPCVAALGAVYREAGFKWTMMVAVWTFILGWSFATAYYQYSLLGTPLGEYAVAWLIGLTVALIALFLILRMVGKRTILSDKSMLLADNAGRDQKGSCCE